MDLRMVDTFEARDEKMKKIIGEKASPASDVRRHAKATPHGKGTRIPHPAL
jgi:hypothetical protein